MLGGCTGSQRRNGWSLVTVASAASAVGHRPAGDPARALASGPAGPGTPARRPRCRADRLAVVGERGGDDGASTSARRATRRSGRSALPSWAPRAPVRSSRNRLPTMSIELRRLVRRPALRAARPGRRVPQPQRVAGDLTAGPAPDRARVPRARRGSVAWSAEATSSMGGSGCGLSCAAGSCRRGRLPRPGTRRTGRTSSGAAFLA